MLKQKRLAAEARAAVEAAEAEAVAVEAKAAVTKKIAEARVAAATEAAKLEEVEIDAQIAAEEAQQSRASVSDESLELSASPLPPQALQEPFEKNGQHQGNSWCQAACPAAEGNEPPLWSNPFVAKPEVVQPKVENAMGNLPFYGEEAVFVDAVDELIEESAQEEGVAERRPFDQWEDVEEVAERRSFTQQGDVAVEMVPLFYESMEFQDPVKGSAGGPTLIQQNFVTHNSCEINSTVINQAQIIEANIIMVAEARHEQKMRAAQAAYTAAVEESEAKVREAERCRQLVFQEASSRVGEIRSREEETSRRNKELASTGHFFILLNFFTKDPIKVF